MVHNLGREDFILSHFDLLERANLGRVAGDAKKQLRGAVSPMDAQCEMFFDVLHVRS